MGLNNLLSSSASKVISKGDLRVLVETMMPLLLIRVGSSFETETDEVDSVEGGRGAIKNNLGSVAELDVAHFLYLFCLPLVPAIPASRLIVCDKGKVYY